MTTLPSDEGLLIIYAPRCRRSRRILDYVRQKGIPHRAVDIRSPEGQALQARWMFRASPGLLVNGQPLNPFEVLDPAHCRVDEEAFRRLILDPLERRHAAGI